jgi:Holliday junction resolvase RusA-like endonuclease
MIKFEIPGEPTPKARPRFRIIGKGKAQRVMTYNTAETVQAEKKVSCYFLKHHPGFRPLEAEPLRVSVTAIHSIPKSWTKKRKQECITVMQPKITRPDGDNILKLVTDALNGVAYKDDGLITEMNIKKFYGSEPMTIVEIERLNKDRQGVLNYE